MTRTRRSFFAWILVLAIVLTASFTGIFILSDKPANADPLPSLQNVTVDGNGVLSWTAFEGAADYTFMFGHGGGSTHGETSVDLEDEAMHYHLATGTHNWSVYAKDSSGNQISATASGTYTFTNTQTPLDAPTSLTWDRTKARWEVVPGAASYMLHAMKYDDVHDTWNTVNVIGQRSLTNYFDFGTLFEVDTMYRFTIYAEADYDDLEHTNSAVVWSSEEDYLYFPHVAATLTNVTITDGILDFDDVAGEAFYEIGISYVGGKNYAKPINLYNHCDISSLPSGTYDVTINVYNEYKEPLVPKYVAHGFEWDTSYGRQPITGTVSITGTAKYGQTVTADITNLVYEGSGTLTYTWEVKNVFDEWVGVATGASDTYTVDTAIGRPLRVRVTCDENLGYVASDPTSAILPSDDALTGTISFDGDIAFDSEIEAVLNDSNNTDPAFLNYQWRRNGVNIVGATSAVYVPVEGDIGTVLSVVITSDCYQGSITSGNTATVTKGHRSAPYDIDSTGCTNYQDNDGTITGVDTTMEYKLSTALNWTDVTGTTITGLASGTYYVRYKETNTYLASASIEVNVASAPTRSVSVQDGYAMIDGNPVTQVAVGATVTIVADAPDDGYIFDYWYDNYETVTFADDHSATTTFVMPLDHVYVAARYTGAPLTGTITITGTLKYGQQLYANNGTNSTCNLSYQWKRDGVNIVDATSHYYILVAADVGHRISVVGTSVIQTGSVESAQTDVIDKANGGDAPNGIDYTACTNYLNNDGTITGVDTTMEYKLSTAENWTAIAGTTITNLTPGTYYVRFKESATHYASNFYSIPIDEAPTNHISVGNGVAKVDGVTVEYAAPGETVTIIANAPNTGYVFDYWEDNYDNVTLADDHNATTTFVMPSNNVYVYGNYTYASLSGTVSISGETKYAEELTAVENTNNTGTLHFQWKRNGSDIGAYGQVYQLQEEDIGCTISVLVTSSNQTGSLLSASTAVVTKADGPAAPSVVACDCTDENNNNGIINGVGEYMEWKLSTELLWTDGDGLSVINLIPGTYQVRIKETATYFAGEIANVVVNAYDAPTLYSITVNNGFANPTSAEAGTSITITANEPAANYEFDKWTTTDGVSFTDENATTTTFILPESSVTVTATYRLVKHAVSFNANGGSGSKDPVLVEHGSMYTLPENPFTAPAAVGYDGYAFGGWALTNDGDAIEGEQIAINADTTLFAVWNESHVHVLEAHAAVAATCTAAGNSAYWYCDGCHAYFSDEAGENEIMQASTVIAALGHDYHATVTAPTCTEQGYITHACSRCEDSYIDTYVDELGHLEVIDEAQARTCTEDGKTQGKHCSRCGAIIVAQTITPALGHDFGPWTVTTPAQIGVAGEETRVCSRDHYHVETRAIDPLPNPSASASATASATASAEASVTPAPDKKGGGLGAGAIVAIVVAVVVVGGVGGFALVWFVIKKKTWADFTALFKKK